MKLFKQSFTAAALLAPFFVAFSAQPSLAVDDECRDLPLPATITGEHQINDGCLLYTSPSPRDQRGSRMPSSA